MDWSIIADAVVAQVLVPALLAVIGALGAWLLTKLPGPLREWLDSGTHRRDMELLLGAMTRQGLVLARDVVEGRLTPGGAASRAMSYARSNLPGTVAKLAPSTDALRTMATAALAEAVMRMRPGPVASPTTAHREQN